MPIRDANPRVPAEWEPLESIWIAWPHQRETWPGHFEPIPDFYADWIRCLAESTSVRVIAGDEVAKDCERALTGVSAAQIVDIATNDCWIRDYGPVFVKRDNDLWGVSWKYNAWGGKYPPWDLDDAVAPMLCQSLDIDCDLGALCLEGGALEFDGHGRLLTTPQCLLSQSRNPGVDTEQVSQQLHAHLGALEIAWIDGGGLAGDDTDGHIDQLARFIDRENVVVAVCDDRNDENHAGLEANYRQLHLWGDATSPNVDIHRLPIPRARHIDGKRLPESYCNFLRLGPDRMLVPTFGAATDDAALGLLRELSDASVEGVDCRDLVWGLGSLHCASLNQPAIASS